MSEETQHPKQVDFLWPNEHTGPLRGRYWIGQIDGRPAIVGVELWGCEPEMASWAAHDHLVAAAGLDPLPDAAIRAEDVRLPLGRLLDDWVDRGRAYARAARALGSAYADTPLAVGPGHEKAVRSFEERLERPRPGRPALSDEFLTRVTEVYNEAVKRGDRNPAVRVKEELGARRQLKTARGWVGLARKRGFSVVDPPRR